MKVTLAAVADHASVDPSGKLSVQGAFDRVFAPKYPAVHASMALALRLQVDPEDGGKTYSLRIRLLDQDGRMGLEGTAKLDVRPISPGDFASPAIAIQLQGVPIPQAGRYHFEVGWDGMAGPPIEVPFIAANQPATA